MKARNAWTTVLAVCAITAGLCLLTMPDADAAAARPEPPPSGKSFNWSFTGTCCITSRPFTATRKAPIVVVSVVEPCETRFGRTEYVVGLWRGKTFLGWREHTCWGSAKWKAQPAGEYRFRLVILPPWRDSQTFTGYGTVYYDGAAP